MTSPAVVSRRSLTLGALGALAVGGLAACGGATGADVQTAPSQAADGARGATDPFPLTVEHKLGSSVIAAAPTRVVSVGLTEQDFLLALGVVPVGNTDWYGDQPNAIWPWAKQALGGAEPPKMLTNADGVQYVEVAKLKPDLIVGLNSGADKANYAKLSKIAPTIGPPLSSKSDYFDSWPLYLATIAKAVGRSQAATELEAAVRQQFADAAAANPEFAGKKALFIQGAVYDGNFYVYQKGLGTEFLTDLGFDVPANVDKYVPAEGGQALVPAERIAELDSADYLIWATEDDASRAALEKLPGFAELKAVKQGHSIYTGAVLAGAIYFSTPLSLPYVVENLVPLLKA